MTVFEGASLTLSVDATVAGEGELSYQWYKGDEAIEGATSASYTINAVALSDAGNYKVKVTNTDGEAVAKVSKECALTVAEKGSYDEITETTENVLADLAYTVTTERDLAAYDDSARTRLTDGKTAPTYDFTDTNVAYLFKNSPSTIEFNLLAPKKVKEIVFNTYVNHENGTAPPSRVVVEVKNGTTWGQIADVAIVEETDGVESQYIKIKLADEAIVVEGLRFTMYKGAQSWLIMDEIEAFAIREATKPLIQTNLVTDPVTLVEGEAVLEVIAVAPDALSYQWYKDGAPINDATESTYIATEAGSYYVVITNTLGETTATVTSATCTVNAE